MKKHASIINFFSIVLMLSTAPVYCHKPNSPYSDSNRANHSGNNNKPQQTPLPKDAEKNKGKEPLCCKAPHGQDTRCPNRRTSLTR